MSPQLQEKIEKFLTIWHDNGRASFERFTPTLDYDSYQSKRAIEKRKYVLLDHQLGSQWSGDFMIDKETEYVYRIKAYGQRGNFINTLDGLIDHYLSPLQAKGA